MSREDDLTIETADILIVDDESANLKLLSDILARDNYHVRPANSPELAVASALENPPDLILLDIRMQNMNGFEVCASLKQHDRTCGIPILFISALQKTADKIRAFEAGGVDFITKPFQEEEVLARVRTHLQLRNMQLHREGMVAEPAAGLTRSEQLARSLLKATTDLTLLVDEDGTILEFSDAMAAVLGGTREELIGTCVFDLFTKEMARAMRKILNQALVGGKPIRYTDRHRPGLVFDTGFYPVRSPAGEKGRVVVFAHDITEQKRMEQALKENEERLRTAQKIARLGYWEWDVVKDDFSWSDEMYRIYGIDPGTSLTLEFLLEMVHLDDLESHRQQLDDLIRGNPVPSVSYRILQPDGSVRFLYGIIMSEPDDQGVVTRIKGTLQDITELRTVETAFRESEARLKKAQAETLNLRLEMAHLNRIMTMNELAASFAHEINQPLGAIVNNAGAARLLMDRPQDAREEIGEILDDILADAYRAGQIIRKIRGGMTRGDAAYASLDLNLLLDEVLAIYQNSFSLDRVFLVVEKDPDLLPIKGDMVRLQQVLMNLITNAIDAMADTPQKGLTFKTFKCEGRSCISVKDTGPGIKESIIDKVFETFCTTKRNGMGIGLRLCKSIIEEHGGRIWAENNPHAGATFYFALNEFSEGE